ncbi:MAG: lipopolysaccharide heptosyltransferase II [Candidatus Zixiibacteriota bacterium]
MRKEIEKILIIRFSSLGDIILTTPVLETLKVKFPQSQIYFLTKAKYSDLLANDPRIHTLIEFDPQGKHKRVKGCKRLVKQLRSYDFDLLIDLHSNLRSFFLRHLVKSGIKTKYRKRWFSRFLMVHFKFLNIKPVSTLESYLGVFKNLQIEPEKKIPALFVDQDDIEYSEKFILDAGIKKDDIVIGVHPGARWETKRWDEEKFEQVCHKLIQKIDCKFILFGDSEDGELIRGMAEKLPNSKVTKAIGLSLSQLMSLVKNCDCLITNDSGPMHIAEALRVPVIAIFGPTHPQLGFAPTGSDSMVLCADVKCSPCSLHGKRKCHKKTRLCMDLITPDMVVEAVEGLLKKKSVPKGV